VTASVVVGGASGIGAAVAAAQRAAGHDVLVWDVGAGADVRCDIADPAAVEVATAATLERIGPPDVVSITAGIGHGGMLLDTPAEDWDRVIGTNAKGVWLAMRALARSMLDGAGGSIVVTSSVSARVPDASMGLYCASKAALDMLVRVAAVEWAPAVRVNAVAPGVTDTPMLGPAPRHRGWLADVASRTPGARLGTADDVAAAVLALHQLEWVTGEVVTCDGGLSLHSAIDPLGAHRRSVRPPAT
jgi:NAD(P)-dependent dehydrogenase (short-subunit alcohol dehydrogenase family)